MKVCLREPLRVFVVREQAAQLVAEDGDAARLEADERHARVDLVAQLARAICCRSFLARSRKP